MYQNPKLPINVPDKINVADETEMRIWADKFDVTKAKLKAAINAIGNNPKDVESYLKRNSRK